MNNNKKINEQNPQQQNDINEALKKADLIEKKITQERLYSAERQIRHQDMTRMSDNFISGCVGFSIGTLFVVAAYTLLDIAANTKKAAETASDLFRSFKR